jgi:DNA polymerase I-like protein with 3'-5' exonuclease and polymerase domains
MKLPDLSAAKWVSVDIETHDPNLKVKGPGGVRNDGHILGVAIAVDGWSGYVPLNHSDMEKPRNAKQWLKKTLGTDVPKLGANLLYDTEWLRAWGVGVKGPWYDVQTAEALLDEDRHTYALDSLSGAYLGRHKKTGELEAAAKRAGVKYKKDVREVLSRLPGPLVAKYAIEDAVLPPDVFKAQKKRLDDEGLWECFLMETALLPVVLDMRFLGVRVDLKRAEKVLKQIQTEERTVRKRLNNLAGTNVDIWSNNSIERMAAKLGLPYPKTVKGNASFAADWLGLQDADVWKLLLRARKLDRGGAVYVRDKIIEFAVGDRIYPCFHPVRTDEYGTVSGRFSSSRPNFQQIPSRDEYLAPLIRSIMIPEDGCEWCKEDYSQQEPRVTVHYAFRLKLLGANIARQMYIDNPRTDFHQMTADLAEIERKPAKTINLGLTYGMGKKKLGRSLGLTLVDADNLFNRYHAAVPYIRLLKKHAERVAQSRGYIRTLSGRRKRFQLFGPPEFKEGDVPLKLEDALKRYGAPVKRYFLHKSLNALIQGSSADMTKLSLIATHKAGYVPHLTVHDENDYSITSRKQAYEIKEIMENVVTLEVPLVCDAEVGPNWGNVERLAA